MTSANTRKFRNIHPERIRRSKVICLVREDEIEAVKAISREHREEIIPILARIVPASFQLFIMKKNANASHGNARRLLAIRQMAVPSDLFSRFQKSIHQATRIAGSKMIACEF